MHVSLNEIESTVCKAGWGVGLSLGLGEEAGRAARRLVVLGLQPLAAYAEALERVDAGGSVPFDPERALAGAFEASTPDHALSALYSGPAVRDLLAADKTGGSIVLTQLDAPLLVLAELLAGSEADGRSTAFSGDALAGRCHGGALQFSQGDEEQLQALRNCTLTIAPAAAPGEAAPAIEETAESAYGLDVDPAVWRRLTGLAARRLVEASETSRLQGAGAGLVDRD